MILIGGDALIDWIPARAEGGRDAFVPVPGGSCVNIAVALGRLGVPVGFVGGISRDLFGEALIQHLETAEVDVGRVTRSGLETTLAFTRVVDGEARYAFYDDGTASRQWLLDDAMVGLGGVDLVHVGSVTLINQPSAAEFERLVERASAAGALISIDPNCRPSLVNERPAYGARIARIMAAADIIRLSDDDFDYLHPNEAIEEVAQSWLDRGTTLVVLTRGAAGAEVYSAHGKAITAACPVSIADTIGAGDSFHAAFLCALFEAGKLTRQRLASVSADEIEAALGFAARAAALTCARPGADPPTRAEMQP